MDDHTEQPEAASPQPSPQTVPTPASIDVPPAPCTPSLDDLYRYLDGQPDTARQAFLKSKLAACGGCVEQYELQAQFRRLIEMRCQSELPADLRDKVFGAITELELGPDGRS